jgi:hypothetical protein
LLIGRFVPGSSFLDPHSQGSVVGQALTVLKVGGFGGLQSAAVRGHVVASRELNDWAYKLASSLVSHFSS